MPVDERTWRHVFSFPDEPQEMPAAVKAEMDALPGQLHWPHPVWATGVHRCWYCGRLIESGDECEDCFTLYGSAEQGGWPE